ncbi:UDP-Glc:alpha-D-GlcNAc-diphosphoundecaprenol beta-1,3-glucosyltransferase WfgD [Pseudomonas sp. ACN8]|uniref:glycosyltransferase n=1 Tax=Pseudomonas sp. ACN8 TaxID=1920428 RepID=UPI001D67B309|nr:UDP-Glc:alpha-D-GlcNAc-diphosphoundecaprenol beta-1,3-glucosyltransferase WfgD [Pseudomonas sp. ACN8]
MVPRYLVMLAAYNGRQWIAEQVNSILNQEDVSVTLLISVDTSDDGTEQWVTDLAESDCRVKYLPHGGKFGGAARNFFRLVKDAPTENFDYFSFADQDDIWLPRKLIQAVHVMSKQGVDGYSGNVTAFWPDGRECVIIKSQPQVQYDHLFEAAGPGCTYVFSKILFVRLQEHIAHNFSQVQNVTLHDWYCYAFSRTHDFTWEIDSNSYMRYRQHANNQVGVNSGVKAFRARLSKVFDGWWLNQSLLISTLIGVRDTPFVRSWSNLRRLDLARLAFAGFRCRRRLRDKFVFTGLCLTLVILRQNK